MLGIDKRLIVSSTSKWIFIGIGAGIVSLALSVVLYSVLGAVIDGAIDGENVLRDWLPWLAALLVGKAFLGWLFRLAQFRASAETKITIRDLVYRQALKLGPALLDKRRTGELVNTAVDGMNYLEMFYGVYVIQFAIGMATPILLCIYVAVIDWVVGLALIVAIPLTPVFLGLMSKNFRGVSDRFAEANNRLSARFLDSLQGMTTLKMFNQGSVRGAEMHRENERQRVETMQLLAVNQTMIAFVDFGFALGTTLVLTIVGLLRLDGGYVTAGEVVALVLISAEFSKPLSLIGEFFFAGAIGREIANKILAFLDIEPSVREPGPSGAGAAERVRPEHPGPLSTPSVSLQHVSYQYPNTDEPAVTGFSMQIEPGETVALIGHSGSGKTTVTNLILRTLQADSGNIRLGNHAVDEVPIDWVRAQIALVPQDPYLFYGTIAENLRVAKAEASQDELIAATRAANIYDFIAESPKGFDTMVGERGLALSGGQVQRVAIARALLKDAPIVILDEPTSQIDMETEGLVQQAIAQLTASKTVLMVAHRLSTVERADRIVVMANGRLVESGSPGELLAAGGAYARMVNVHDGRAQADRGPQA